MRLVTHDDVWGNGFSGEIERENISSTRKLCCIVSAFKDPRRADNVQCVSNRAVMFPFLKMNLPKASRNNSLYFDVKFDNSFSLSLGI